MEKLNDNCLLILFGNLNVKDLVAVAKVSRKWKNVAYSRSLWRQMNVRLKCGLKPLSVVMLSSLEDRGVCNIRMTTKDELSLLPCDAAQYHLAKQLQRVIQSLPLRHLDLEDYELHDQKIQALFSQEMTNLKWLALPRFSEFSSVLHVSRLCPNLLTLSAIFVCIPSDKISVLDRNMPHLRHLLLAPTPDATDDAMRDIRLHMPYLWRVNVHHTFHVTNDGIAELARMRHLHHLSLMDCQGVTGDFIRILAEANSPIKSLEIWDCRGIDYNQMLTNIGQHCLPLEEIKIQHRSSSPVTDAGIAGLVQNTPNPLKRLQLPDNHQVTRETGEALIRKHCPDFENFRPRWKEYNCYRCY